MKARILCPTPQAFSTEGIEYASQYSDLILKDMNQREFDKSAIEFDAVMIRFNINITDLVIGKHSKIKAIICPTTGLDHIDLELCNKNCVKVYHLNGENAFLNGITSTAELTIALMLSFVRYINQASEAVLRKEWDFDNFRGRELQDKTIGIVGLGRLGNIVAGICSAMLMNVVFYDVDPNRQFKKGIRKNSLEDLLKISDFVTLHIPLNEDTFHLISHRQLNLMKISSILINTSRGAIIDSKALYDALITKQISGAALDVVENEPMIQEESNILIEYAKKNKNLLITPHIGGSTMEAVAKTDMFVLNKFFENYIC